MITDREKYLMLLAVNALRDKFKNRRAYMQDIDEWISKETTEMFIVYSADAWVDLMETKRQQDKIKSTGETLKNHGLNAAINEALK